MLQSLSKARMKLHGSTMVIMCCLLIHISSVITKIYLLTGVRSTNTRVSTLFLQGLIFLVYPLLGHLADVYLTRYRMLKCGLVILTTGWLWIMLISIANIILSEFKLNFLQQKGVATVLIPEFILVTVGLGVFKANAIQFGLDQLLEAPTPKLISFIHWYYWSQNVGGLVVHVLHARCSWCHYWFVSNSKQKNNHEYFGNCHIASASHNYSSNTCPNLCF